MKSTFSLLAVMVFLLFSCGKEDDSRISTESSVKEELSFKRLTNSKIGYEKDGKVKLDVSDEKIMASFRKYIAIADLEIEPQYCKVITIHSKNYLRFYGKDMQVSTIALIKNSDNEYRTGNTVCTSTACASCCGCLPDGDYCTKCTRYQSLPGGPTNDCKRSTTGFE
ncbi:hypothetical protein [Psychroserpens sp. SPM9]|uniref:hypothetical protein n=1 Tax=Psychroserpens sp. SPM9 TaxID=2975598 RepID=UPI0021A54CE4|nr:hypothetical protein [Psychroserpens sp. SPM9]MDG5490735.1 hypothetical protein [Psychroserpens sp. SPM9]